MDAHAEALYRRWHKPMVVYAAGALNHDYATAEDLVQQVWLGYYRAVQRGEAIQNTGHFLFRILTRRIVDEIRWRQRNRRVLSLNSSPVYTTKDWDGRLTLENLIHSTEVPVADEAANLADMRVIRDAIDALPEHYRLAVEARVHDGMTMMEHAAVAERAGFVKEGGNAFKAADNHYYRALAVLRERLQSELPLLGA